VDEACWGGFELSLKENKPLETATTAFLDALSAFVSNKDAECVYRLCLALEIMESKLRRAKGTPTKAYALRLLNGAQPWKIQDKPLLKKMFVDRGHITHGEKPHHCTENEKLLFEYLDLCKRYYEQFLQIGTDIGWGKLSEY